jgi:transposase-like protein/IS1 family transposase
MELKFMSEPPLDATLLTCPYCGEEERIWIHSQRDRRLRCGTCDRTFTESKGTPLYGLQYPRWLVLVVVSLLAHGCPVQAIVFAFLLDERTVVDWHTRVGRHAQRVQAEVVCRGDLEVGQVQGDELCIKTQLGTVWLATAMCVFTRLFIWGEVSVVRNTALVQRVVVRVRAAARRGTPILWVTDGFGGWLDAVRRVFRDPLRTGKRGRPRLQLWADLLFVQVVKHKAGRRLLAMERRLRLGTWAAAQEIMCATQTQLGTFNTAYVERLNATLRSWLPALTRRSRTPARDLNHLEAALFWTGCVYNFCRIHATLDGTPAMAAGLTEEVWSVRELLYCFTIKPKSLHATL